MSAGAITGRVMGVDYGTTRVGVAISDGLQISAQPHSVVPAEGAAKAIAALIEEEHVVYVVVGLPLHLSGDANTSSEGARALAEKLRTLIDVPVALADERFTSKIAERVLLEGNVRRRERREAIDKVAAAVMLQAVLDRPDGLASLTPLETVQPPETLEQR